MKQVTIVGAGIVGICCGLSLQREGHQVTLIDPLHPGSGCSYGNGGLLQSSACVPIATPGILQAVPRMLLDPDQPLVINWRHLPRLAPYLLRFLAAARPARVEEISKALTSLLAIALPSYRPLIFEAGAGDLVRPSGELHIYQTASAFRSGIGAHDLRRRRGVRIEVLDDSAARQLEPSLAPSVYRAVLLPEPEQTLDPYDFAAHLAAHFVQLGGIVRQEKVLEIVLGQKGPVAIVTDTDQHEVDQLVIAAGAYSGRFARRLGSPVPLDSERGYHLMLPQPGITLRVPLLSGDYRFGLIQMSRGIRLVGTAELSRLDAPPDYRRAERLLLLARRIVPDLDGTDAKPWMGHRPSTPDSLPVICRSPRYSNAYFAFGHGHLGLTLAAASGRIIADLIGGREPPLAMEAFHVSRFRIFGGRSLTQRVFSQQ